MVIIYLIYLLTEHIVEYFKYNGNLLEYVPRATTFFNKIYKIAIKISKFLKEYLANKIKIFCLKDWLFLNEETKRTIQSKLKPHRFYLI